MNVDGAAGPLKIQARVLKPPILKYGPGSKQATIVSVHTTILFQYPYLAPRSVDSCKRCLEHVRFLDFHLA